MWICHRSNRRNLNVNAAANDDSFASDTNKEELLIWKRKMWNMPFVRGKYQNESGTLSYVLCNYYRLLKVSNQCDLLCFISLWASREALYRVYSGTPCDYPRKHWHFNDFKATQHFNQLTRTTETIFESDKTLTMELCLKLSGENGWWSFYSFS